MATYHGEHNDLVLYSLLTIMVEIKILGDNDVYKVFKIHEQYEFTDTEERFLNCDQCWMWWKGKQLYYEVTLDDVVYWIPKEAIAIESRVRRYPEINIETYKDLSDIQPADWKETYKEVTGIDVDKIEDNLIRLRQIARLGYDPTKV